MGRAGGGGRGRRRPAMLIEGLYHYGAVLPLILNVAAGGGVGDVGGSGLGQRRPAGREVGGARQEGVRRAVTVGIHLEDTIERRSVAAIGAPLGVGRRREAQDLAQL